jgi:hypothetical protein
MSKLALKKHLQTFSKEQIIETILELYDNVKPAKEYLEFFMNPNELGMLKKYRTVIVSEFYPKGKFADPKTCFSVAKKAISEFRTLKTSAEWLSDLMVTLAEMACKFTYDLGDMWEQYYNSAYTNFKAALEFLHKNNLLDNFKLRCEDCVKYASLCDDGSSDDIFEIYCQY